MSFHNPKTNHQQVTGSMRCHRIRRVLLSALAGVLFESSATFGCGPFFPNTLLDRGDRAVLYAPQARFGKEIERMKLVAPSHLAKPATNAPLQSAEADLSDLNTALGQANVPVGAREAIIKHHGQERQKIRMDKNDSLRPTNTARIQGPIPQVVPGLPGEFADYFRGAVAWHLNRTAEARSAWTRLLQRPAAERHFKSTWAAFMLGRSLEEEKPSLAIAYFREVRSLAKAGFADSLGLAAESFGFEARLHLREKRFAQSIDLYLEQAAAGDLSAVLSLRWAVAHALVQGASALRPLASHPRAQRVVTAYIIAGGWAASPIDTDSFVKESTLHLLEAASSKTSFIAAPKPGSHSLRRPALVWLEAVEDAKVKDVDSAEQLALGAYQAGEMQTAQRWLGRARSTPVTQWLQAKLLLRDGNLDAAAALLAQICRSFPAAPEGTDRAARASLANSLYLADGRYTEISIGQQMRGELGVFHLARRQYSEALDALLRSGYWTDAAYVAERVLTLDELKSFVDQHWPEVSRDTGRQEPGAEGREKSMGDAATPDFRVSNTSGQLRHLLARRLTRANRISEAGPYYPPAWRPSFDRLCVALSDSRKAELPAADRAKAYFEAATITRKSGLELVGTELAPDCAVYGGDFEEGVNVIDRANLQATNVLAASAEEIERGLRTGPQPELRWHYRYTAATLAWEAAKLMPNNSEDTARVLCIGGSWIKYLDKAKADLFYKALVRRCRKTAIGAEADRIRWFPLLDERGDLLPGSKQPLSPQERAAKTL